MMKSSIFILLNLLTVYFPSADFFDWVDCSYDKDTRLMLNTFVKVQLDRVSVDETRNFYIVTMSSSELIEKPCANYHFMSVEVNNVPIWTYL